MQEILKQNAFYRVQKIDSLRLISNCGQADNCTFKWSSTGRHLLALASTDMSQESYYGENNLYLLNANNGER